MIITKIEVQKKNKERYNLFADKQDGAGEQYAFSVDQQTLITYELKKGMVLDDLALTEVLFYEDIRKATNLALNYLSYQLRTTKEVYIYLEEKEVAIPIIQEVLISLKQQKYLNDKEYAYAYVRTQANVTGKGPTSVKQDLKEKGIVETDSEEAIFKFYSFEQQVENATKWLRKKAKGSQKYSIRDFENRIKQYLVSKGFSWDVIGIVLEEFEQDDEQEIEALKVQFEKYKRKYTKYEGWEYEQKIKNALYRKGFKIEDIEKLL